MYIEYHRYVRQAVAQGSRRVLTSVVVAVEKWKAFLCFPSAASFPRPLSSRQLRQRLMSVVSAAGQDGPGDAR